MKAVMSVEGFESGRRWPGEDPLGLFSRFFTKAKTIWMQLTYPFVGFGKGVSIHYSCDVPRPASSRMQIGDNVFIARGTWLTLPYRAEGGTPAIILANGCKIGRRCTLSARNLIQLEEDVLLGPSVLIMDHNHQYFDTDRPIHTQGITAGGKIIIERNCWLGYGAAILCDRGELRLGRNSVVGAGAVVTRSFPPFSVVGGNPAKLLKTFDRQSGRWIKPRE